MTWELLISRLEVEFWIEFENMLYGTFATKIYSVLHQGRCGPAVIWAEFDAIWIAELMPNFRLKHWWMRRESAAREASFQLIEWFC